MESRAGTNNQLHSLTPMRGIAALWVVLYHYAVWYFPAIEPGRYSHLLDKGYLAVDMFFMLSGFVMTHVYWRAFVKEGGSHYWAFLSARIARLYPLHLFVLALFLAIAAAFRGFQYAATGRFDAIPMEGARSLSALLANLFMLQGLKASELSWNYPAWSISVEFIAYLAFPFMLPWIWRASTPAKVGLTGVVVAVLSLFSWLTGNNFDQWDGPQTLLRCLPEFLLGTLLYAAFTSDAGTNWLRRDATVVTTAAVALILLHLGAADLFAILCFPVLILAAVSNEGYVAKLMNVAPLVWLGEVSYSLYLVHGFVEYATTQFIDAAGLGGPAAFSGKASVVVMLTMIGASLAMSSVTYRSVESAGRRRLRQMLGQTHA